MDPFYSADLYYTLWDAENQTTRRCQAQIFVATRNTFSGVLACNLDSSDSPRRDELH